MDIEEQIMSEVSSAAAEAEAPSETPEVTPAASEPEVTPVETPADSSKDDFYKSQYENLQKDYTRKAQELAELKKTNHEPNSELPWETDPNYQPKTWKEVFDMGKQATLREVSPLLSEVEQSRQMRQMQEQAQKAVEAELTELKTANPKLDENAVFQHANKFHFNSLKAALDNLNYIRNLEKDVQAKVLKNLKLRADEPVGVSGATPADDDADSYEEITQTRSIRDAAAAAYARLKGNK